MKSLVKKITAVLVAVAMITALMPSLTFADGVSAGVRFTVSGRDFFVVDGAEKVKCLPTRRPITAVTECFCIMMKQLQAEMM